MPKAKIPHTDPAQNLPAAASTPKGKLGALITLLHQPEGVTLEAMQAATGWQAHSVRGALAGSIKKKLGFAVASEKVDGVRRYRIEAGRDAG